MAGIVVTAAPAGTAPAPAALEPALLDAALDAVAAAGPPAAIAEVRVGDQTWSQARGERVLDAGPAAEPTDRVRIGSLTKSMVTTVVLQLVAEEKLSLDDAVADHLPDVWPYEADVTVRQLLSHTSGVPDYFDQLYPSLAQDSPADVATNRTRHYSPEEIVEIATAAPLGFTPGSDYQYSNTGYFLVALVVEAVTGRSIGSELADRLFTPLGMASTYLPGVEVGIDGAHPHAYFGTGDPADPLIDTTEFSATQLWAAGGVVSTVADVNVFYRAMSDGTLLSSDLVAQARAVTEHSEYTYGLGLERVPAECDAVPEGVAYGHGGDTMGYTTKSYSSPDGQRQATVTVTLDPGLGSPDQLNEAINDFLVAGLCARNELEAGEEPEAREVWSGWVARR